MSLPKTPASVAEALELDQVERIRGVHDREERERQAIPLREYVRHRPERVPAVLDER
jgi:hypothetical protein